jgi:type II secretory pathway pseudopilin PulG
MKGFTLIEFLISISIFMLLAGLFTIGIDFYERQELENQTQNIIETLRRAQFEAISGKLDSSFGIYFEEKNYTLFKGESFSQRDSSFDEIFELPPLVTLEGLSEIVFLKSEGTPKENPAHCEGNCTPCDQFTDKNSCLAQEGCSWNNRKKICSGTCTPCQNYLDQMSCQQQSGCLWISGSKGGNVFVKVKNQSKTININEVGRINVQ